MWGIGSAAPEGQEVFRSRIYALPAEMKTEFKNTQYVGDWLSCPRKTGSLSK